MKNQAVKTLKKDKKLALNTRILVFIKFSKDDQMLILCLSHFITTVTMSPVF